MNYLSKQSGNKVSVSWGNKSINASGKEGKMIATALAIFFVCYGLAFLIKANQ